MRQVVINANLGITDVIWPGCPPLFELGTFETNNAYAVMQIHLWSPIMKAWVKLVPYKTGEQGVIEATFGDIEAIKQYEAQGVPTVEAIRRVLGATPG